MRIKLLFIIHLMNITYAVSNGVVSCKVTGRPGRDTNLTLDVTYEGEHRKTQIRFENSIGPYTNITKPCEVTATNLSVLNCTTAHIHYLYFYYVNTRATNSNITLSEFNFPTDGANFSGDVISVCAVSNTVCTPNVLCDPFSVPSLYGNIYIYILIYII